jgi:hypothetical protein
MAPPGLASGAVAVSEDSLGEEHFLGRLATYTLPDEERNGAKLLRTWAKHGLNVDDLPEARQPVHVFQSACASVNTRRTNIASGQRAEIRADEVENNGSCSYQITVKVWDLKGVTIEHEKAMRVRFDKQTNAISFDMLGYQDKRLHELQDRIRSHFEANAKTVPGQKVRNAVRATLLKCGAQNLRRKAGGLYFVPGTGVNERKREVPTKAVLDGLKGVLTDLYGDRADFYTIPLVNDDGQREMVRKHFTINANEKARELSAKAMSRVRQGRGQRGVRAELVTNLHQERRLLVAAVGDFEKLVEVERKDIQASLDELDLSLERLEELANEKP